MFGQRPQERRTQRPTRGFGGIQSLIPSSQATPTSGGRQPGGGYASLPDDHHGRPNRHHRVNETAQMDAFDPEIGIQGPASGRRRPPVDVPPSRSQPARRPPGEVDPRMAQNTREVQMLDQRKARQAPMGRREDPYATDKLPAVTTSDRLAEELGGPRGPKGTTRSKRPEPAVDVEAASIRTARTKGIRNMEEARPPREDKSQSWGTKIGKYVEAARSKGRDRRDKDRTVDLDKISDAGSHKKKRTKSSTAATMAAAGVGVVGPVTLSLALSKQSIAVVSLLAFLVVVPAVVHIGPASQGTSSNHGTRRRSSSSSGVAALGFQPNIVIVFPDDMAMNDLGYMGTSKPYDTANIDKLATSGVRFNHYYTSPNCAPSRCAVLTGRYNLRNGCQNEAAGYSPWGLPLDEPMFPEVMKSAGYYTVMLGKWHIGMFQWAVTPMGRGFDEFKGFLGGGIDHFDYDSDNGGFDWWDGYNPDKSVVGTHSTAAINSSMVEFIKNRGKDNQPWFMYIPVFAPHGPFEAPDYWINVAKQNNGAGDSSVFIAMMLMIDDLMGTLVATLKDYDQFDQTVIIFAGDHGANNDQVNWNGYMGRCYPFSGSKGSFWEGGARVPAFMYAPFIHEAWQGKDTDIVASVYDWLPTAASLAGVDTSQFKEFDGTDLTGMIFKGDDGLDRDHVLIELNNECESKGNWNTPYAAIRYGDYKMLVDCVTSNGEIKGNSYLYDIVNDYSESNNLMKNNQDKYQDVIKAMQGYLSAYGKEAVDGLQNGQPWAGDDYRCAKCSKGCPTNNVWYPYYDENLDYIGGQCNNNNGNDNMNNNDDMGGGGGGGM